MFKLHFESFEEFIAMGGHGFYVWLCYGVVLFSLVFYFYHSKQKVNRRVKELEKFYQRLDLNNQSSNNSTEQ
ncbi:MAG: heme exporter protein CcmD [Kangiellaceae bacterium]|jgi:heme exporter protein D